MLYKQGKRNREYNPKMSVDEFIESNEMNIYEDYESYYEDEPRRLNDVRNGDTDDMRERASTDPAYYIEVMLELYEDFLNDELIPYHPNAEINKKETEYEAIIQDDIAHEGVRERQATMD